MANYQIKITPVETFFFGSEKHSMNDKGEWIADYFAESNPYPQQTTLLGLVRYLLLLKNESIFRDNRITDKQRAEAYIGASSFDFSNPVNTYGKINAVSPLYLTFGQENYFFAPFDYGCNLSDNLILQKKVDDKLKGYTAKDKDKFIRTAIISSAGDLKKLEEVVKDSPMVGSEKGDRGKTKEDAFYKQNMKYLAKGWAFAIDIEVEDDAGLQDKDVLFVPFGGEKCFFKMEIHKQKQFEPDLASAYQRNCFAIICLSDCFLTNTSDLNKCDFAITDFVSFRNLQSTVKTTKKYSGLSKNDPLQLKQSSRYNLLQRGSVLYFTDKNNFEDVKTAIESSKNVTNIGFNHILTINK